MGEETNKYSAEANGQCFKKTSCDAVSSYKTHLAPTFCMETEWCQDGGSGPTPTPTNAFDSHICFAAASPVAVPEGHRVYYMGGNGPHSGTRNSSFALATLGTDRFAGLSGTGTVTLQ